MDDIYYCSNINNRKQEKNKRPPGRPRKGEPNKNQTKIEDIFKMIQN